MARIMPRTCSLALTALLASAIGAPAHAQILDRLRDAAEAEVLRQLERTVTGMVRCAFDDPACIESAEESGQPVELVDEDGNTITDGDGNPISDRERAEALRQKPGEGIWANYDFVPGSRMLFVEDYGGESAGDFPRRLEFITGNMDVVDSEGSRFLRATGGSAFAVPLPETLPDRFTVQFLAHWAERNLTISVLFDAADGGRVAPRGIGWYQPPHLVVDHRGTGLHDLQGDAPTSTTAAPEIHRGWVAIRLMADGEHVKAYVNEKRVANIPQVALGRSSKIWFVLRDATPEVPMFIGPIEVAAGGRDLYDRLAADGRVATRGILFDSGSHEILPFSTPTLNEIGTMLESHPELRLGIEGHTDDVGGEDDNLELSRRRAEAVRSYLMDAHGIDSGRLEAEGLGESRPADSNDTEEGRANNRRVELVDLGRQEARLPDGGAAAPAMATGDVTTVLAGDSMTLPVRVGNGASTGWDPPGERFDDPSWVRLRVDAGAVQQSGDPWFSMSLVFDRESLEIVHNSQVLDSRARTANGVVQPARTWVPPAPTFTIEAFETRGTDAFVRGTFAATMVGDRSLTGRFEVLAPAECRPGRRPTPDGCTG